MAKTNLFWFRRDLRLHDNAGLFQALQSEFPVVPVFIFDTDILQELENKKDPRVSFIYSALQKVQGQLLEIGSTLDIRIGKPLQIWEQLIEAYDIHTVYTNHDYEPYAGERDRAIDKMLQARGVELRTFKDQVIFEKNEIVKDDGTHYSIYTPYAKKWRNALTPARIKPYPSLEIKDHFYKQPPKLFPTLQEVGFESPDIFPEPINDQVIQTYDRTRDIPSINGTTRFGVHLRFGTVSIRELLARALKNNQTFLGELIWREFFMQMLWKQPRLQQESCKQAYDRIRWRNKESEFLQWCRGETGYPIIDAGMRELNATGFMHNRVRMITASFLVKNLLIDWRWGEAYFAEKLLDYELASNNGNWQWVAGCGCDAAPYFRVFNPETQARRFDPEKRYIKKWVPEWDSPKYTRPIVDLDRSRERCLKVYKEALLTDKQALG
ncbi:MAG TPA: deoxyribodipyrimidine photo-lyase [Flavisolibacter sp.]|jgi:deoxyribodipyrimidine photo-lyase|nr:deoxyribodipyrimidine photo-lyase [Flavisolibacter sp.]